MKRFPLIACMLTVIGCAQDLPYSISIGDPSKDQPGLSPERCVLRLDEATRDKAEQYRDSVMTVRDLQIEFEKLLHDRVSGEKDKKEGLMNCVDHNGNPVDRSHYTELETVSKKWLTIYALDATDPDQDIERFREYLRSAQLVQALARQQIRPDENADRTYRLVEHTSMRQSQWCGDVTIEVAKPLFSMFAQTDQAQTPPIQKQSAVEKTHSRSESHCLTARSLYHLETKLMISGQEKRDLYEYLLSDTMEKKSETDRNRRYLLLGYEIPWDKERTLVRYGVTFYFRGSNVGLPANERAELVGYDLIYANEATPQPVAEVKVDESNESWLKAGWGMTGYPFSLIIGIKNAAFEVAKLPFSLGAGLLFGRDPWNYPVENVLTAWNALYVEATTQTQRGAEWGLLRLIFEIPLIGQVFQYNPEDDRDERDCPDEATCKIGSSASVQRKIFLSRGIYGGNKWGQDTGLWTLFAKQSYPTYEIYSPPYRHGTVIDVVWSMFNLSHGPSYSEARYIMDHAKRDDRLFLAGHSGGVQRSAAASRILAYHGYHVKKAVGVAGPSIGQAFVDTRYPEAFKVYLNTELGANEDVVSQVGAVAGVFSTVLNSAIIVPLKYVVGGLVSWNSHYRERVYRFADRIGPSNATIVPVQRKPSSRHQTPLRLSLTDRLVFDAYVRKEFATAFKDDLERPDQPQEPDRPHAFPWER